MNGTHRSDGIWIAHAGPASASHASLPQPPARLSTVAPWLASAMGLAWTTSDASPDQAAGDDAASPEPLAYDADEEAMVAERLRALGYLE